MSERAAIFEYTRLGFEGTLGTPVAANIRPQTWGILPKPTEPIELLAARGSKINTFARRQKGRLTTAALTGYQAYNDLILAYYLCFGFPTVTLHGVAGANAAYDYVWLLSESTPISQRTATFENGEDATGASRFAAGIGSELTLTMTETAMDLSGTITGRRLAEEGVTSTANPTKLPLIPISADDDDHYVAAALADLGDGLLGTLFASTIKFGGLYKPIFPKRTDETSWKAMVETKNDVSAHIEMEQDSDSNALMRKLRALGLGFYRYHTTGPQIGDGTNGTYEHEVTIPFQVTNPDRGDHDPVYGGMYDLSAVQDATLGGFAKIRVRTSLPASNFAAASAVPDGQAPDDLIAAAQASEDEDEEG